MAGKGRRNLRNVNRFKFVRNKLNRIAKFCLWDMGFKIENNSWTKNPRKPVLTTVKIAPGQRWQSD